MEKKKQMKNKTKLGVSIAAFVAAISIFVILLQIEKNVLSQYERGVVCVATDMIPKGMVMTEDNCRKYFAMEEVDQKCISPSAISDDSSLEGLASVYDIEAGTLLTVGMFESVNEILNLMEEPVIAGFKADDLYQVVGGVLRAGDRIHIFNVSDHGDAELCWEEVYIESVFDQAGKGIAINDKNAGAQRINVYMEKSDVEAFYSRLSGGRLRVVKVCK